MREENKQMRILSAIGMILVVAGHLGYSVFDVGGLFPYYSFHVFIFLFVSGYFYREEAEQHLLQYIGKKCKTLLLPYFIWNLVYGILAAILHRTGFSIGGNLTLWNLFIEPFVSGHQFLYQCTWQEGAVFSSFKEGMADLRGISPTRNCYGCACKGRTCLGIL